MEVTVYGPTLSFDELRLLVALARPKLVAPRRRFHRKRPQRMAGK